jgi:hypothetical protein
MTHPDSPEIAIVRLHENQYALGALPRAGRLPFSKVEVHSDHLVVTGKDGIVEKLGSEAEPLPPGVMEQLRSEAGLVFAELDEDTGAPAATDIMKG